MAQENINLVQTGAYLESSYDKLADNRLQIVSENKPATTVPYLSGLWLLIGYDDAFLNSLNSLT